MFKPARHLVCEEVHEATPPAQWHTPVVLWLRDGPVCVHIVEQPWRDPPQTTCRCGGCHANHLGDLAEKFLD